MNKRQKKKAQKKRAYPPYTSAKRRKKNKYLCERYPFLIPRSMWYDKITWNIPYDYTLKEAFPSGWWKSFGIQLCEDMREELLKHNYLKDFRITDIKEKYGGLRIYFGGVPMECEISSIIDDYSALSENICLECGKPDIPMLEFGYWLQPICKDCYEKVIKRHRKYDSETEFDERYKEHVCNRDSGIMGSERRYTVYVPDKEPVTITRDISSKANQIRARWRTAHEHN